MEAALRHVRILIDRIDSAGIERARAPDNPIYFIPFLEEEFRQIRPVLTGDTGDQRFLHGVLSSPIDEIMERLRRIVHRLLQLERSKISIPPEVVGIQPLQRS
jgi:hypothetical protein